LCGKLNIKIEKKNMKYDHLKIEKKWQKYWEDSKTFKVRENKKKDKFYILDMFPYSSGEGLHVGHPKGYVATDVYARYMILRGKNVLHPMGFDSFGLPAENYAIKNKIHPKEVVDKNIKRFKKQLEQFGFTYDWDREIVTSDPNYYKWTQWIFLKMFEKGLVYESTEPINWCPSCKTGLANEDLENGKCERCDSQIEKKPIRQWVLKMTDYAERLLNDLKLVDWEKSIIDQQINWIGRSEGSLIKFKIQNSKFNSNTKSKIQNEYIKIFTTRADTLFGATYVVVAPEHEIISKLKSQISNISDIEKYIQKSRSKSDLERTDLAKDKTGIQIKGICAINPANDKEIPIFVADYVLANYGTGAIMAVPAHDGRDWQFAKKYNLPIIEVIRLNNKQKLPFINEGKLINSGKFNGTTSQVARKEITKFVSGKEAINYKMRDWVFSRQRYWGEPIPLVHCEKCGVVPIDEQDLPLKLPDVKKYEPTGTGESPLANIDSWINTKCPKCKGDAKRETNTMPQWAGSCWYYLRYIDSKNNNKLVDKEKEKYWMMSKGIDIYVGGAEHATRHLLYARFWHKFLYDLGVVSTKEPFYRLQHVGLIKGEDGRKMSKRWGNVVNPDDIISEYGADAFRMYEMFMGPFADSVSWSTDGVKGTKRFLDRIWDLVIVISRSKKNLKNIKSNNINKLVKKITSDIESFSFNTAISSLMIYFNDKDFVSKIDRNELLEFDEIDLDALEKFLQVLSPFAPHIAEELWSQLGHKQSIFETSWPSIDGVIKDLVINLAVMVNGKKRAVLNIETAKKLSDKQIIELALNEGNVKKHIANKKIKKTIYIPGKIISIVV
jgi:leucyl-tRNA synthetase